MDAKEYLEQARFLNIRINAKLQQRDALRELLNAAAGTESVIRKITAMEEELNQEIDRLVDLKQEIRQTIAQLSKPEYRTLLELRYLCFWSWEKIEMNLHYSERYIFKLHLKALEEIDRNLKRGQFDQ